VAAVVELGVALRQHVRIAAVLGSSKKPGRRG